MCFPGDSTLVLWLPSDDSRDAEPNGDVGVDVRVGILDTSGLCSFEVDLGVPCRALPSKFEKPLTGFRRNEEGDTAVGILDEILRLWSVVEKLGLLI